MVRARFCAAWIDGILVGLVYLPICLFLGWRVDTFAHLCVESLMWLLYYFVSELTTGQTIGKRQYGLRVLRTDGGVPGAVAIAIRSVLRIIDALPSCYLVGLISMQITGADRRQRLGDVAAGVVVVADSAHARRLRTPGWLLPTLIGLAVLVSVATGAEILTARTRPLDAVQRAAWVSSCEQGTQNEVTCQCLLSQLESAGDNTPAKLLALETAARQAELSGNRAGIPAALTNAVLACH